MIRTNKYKFNCPNATTKWRIKSYFTKEPETIDWIDGFEQGETLFDIGANIGLYSIYAAKRGIKVFAFEPDALNYAELNKNIKLNNADVRAYCVALSDKFAFGFQKGGFEGEGASGSQFNTQEGRQGSISFTLDQIVKEVGLPDHIKIDVDGLEPQIVSGGKETLKRIKSLLIEIDENKNSDLVKTLESCGLELRLKTNSPVFNVGEYRDFYNCIFKRKL